MSKTSTNSLISRYLSKTSSEAYLLTDNKFPILYWIDSGNYALNALLSGYWDRGYPSGRFTQLAGPNSVGKTYLFTQAMINAQKDDFIIHAVDAEFGSDTESWIKRGIDPSKFIHNPIYHIKEVTGELLSYIDTVEEGDKTVIVIDSVGNLSSFKETEDHKNFKDTRDMTRAQELKAMFRQLVVPAGKKNIPVFIVNHEYDTLEMYAKKRQGGGGGPAYGSSIIISMTKSQETEGSGSSKEHVGTGVTCTNTKNRFAKEKEKVRIVINYEEGLNRYSGLFDIATQLDFITSSGGAWYTYKGSDEKFYKKSIEHDVDFWEEKLKGEFGIALNNKFTYQSHAAEILDNPVEKKSTKTKKNKKEK